MHLQTNLLTLEQKQKDKQKMVRTGYFMSPKMYLLQSSKQMNIQYGPLKGSQAFFVLARSIPSEK